MDKFDDSLDLKLGNTLKEFCEKTSSHGIPNIVRGKYRFIQILWLVVFLASISYCLVIIIKSSIEYSKYKTKISIQLTPELPTALFPAVTICNINAFQEDKAIAYLKQTPLAQYLAIYQCIDNTDAYEFEKCISANDTASAILDVHVDNLKRFVANDSSLENTRSSLGFDLDKDMLVSCLYNDQPCGLVNFSTFWSNEYGNCYTFNDGTKGEVAKMSKTGSRHGLVLELVVQPPDTETVFSYKSGLRVLIHNQSMIPFTLNTGFNIPTGFETYIGVSRTRRKLLDHPYSNCLSGLEPFSPYSKTLFNYFRDLNVTYYDQDFCYTLCYQDKLNDACGCIDYITPQIKSASYCVDGDTKDDDLLCLYSFKEQYLKSDINSVCKSACPEQCEKIEYDTRTSMATYPSLSYLKFLSTNNYTKFYFPKNVSYLEDFSRKYFLKLVVNYDKLFYTEIRDLPDLTFEEFLGNLGGQLGLFIGISFLSFIELIELAIELVLVYVKHMKNSSF